MRRRIRRSTWLACALALTFRPAALDALDPGKAVTQFVVNVWRMEHGLPHSTVSSITQTRDGFLWVGTYQGLARFDGVSFTVFDATSSSLLDSSIRALCEESDGSLLVGTISGGLYRLKAGERSAFTSVGPGGSVYALLRARDGTVWVGTPSGVARVDGSRPPGAEVLADRQVAAISEAPDGTLWLGTSRGVARLVGGRVETLDWVGDERVRSILADREGRVWVGSNRGLEMFQDGRRTPVEPASDNPVAVLHQDRDGSIWAGSYGAGLHRVTAALRVEVFGPAEGFPDRRAWAIAEDREGSLWVGTRVGLVQLRSGPVTTYSRLEGLPGDLVRAVLEDDDGSILVGTEDGAARVSRAGVVSRLAQPFPGVAYSFLRDRSGDLWVGGQGALGRFPQKGPVRVYGGPEGIPAERVKVLLETRDGGLWAGTGKGLRRHDPEGPPGAAFVSPPSVRALDSDVIEALLEDGKGALWIGTELDGLWRLVDGVLARVPLRGSAAFGVRSLFELPDGTMLVGSSGAGLFVLRGDACLRVSSAQGLRTDALWSMVDDGAGGLFVSSDLGVFRVPVRELLDVAEGRMPRLSPPLTLGTVDGMKSAECNGGGGGPGLRARDGRLWFPTQKGAVVLDPRARRRNLIPPNVVVDEVFVDRKPAERAASGAFVVPPGSQDLEIRYTAPSFADPSRVRFRYRLEGHDEGLVESGPRRAAYYGSLPPGAHVFQVTACNDAGVWSPDGARVTLDVRPLPLQRWPVRAGLVLFGVSLLVTGVRHRLSRLSRQKAELEKLVGERTRSLAEANAELQRLATVDALTSIANRRRFDEVLHQEWSRAQRQGIPLSLLMIDVDSFKAYNDRYGHQAGDACLAGIGGVLRSLARRATDLPARYGGEEFAVVLTSTPGDRALELAEAVRSSVEALRLPHDGSAASRHVTVSVGVASVVPSASDRVEELVERADGALYAAKDLGRNRVAKAL